ncbi:hypothetical protein WAK64_02020 [Bacillus spongiae]|uniref:DUF2802 domain-containing protein n=1 Tax=Bacillus spongiae TaxID=2683610 RepID=A0ABU8H960_9BACI
MTTLIVILFSLSILLFTLSFFLKDPLKQMERDVEEVSINVLQEQYKLKKRISILEEELMLSSEPRNVSSIENDSVHEVVKNQVFSLHSQGLTIEQIAKQSALPLEKVQQLLATTTTN